jgi:hypothetical protein
MTKNWAISCKGRKGVVRYADEAAANRAIMELAEEVFGDALYNDDAEIDAYLAQYEAVRV